MRWQALSKYNEGGSFEADDDDEEEEEGDEDEEENPPVFKKNAHDFWKGGLVVLPPEVINKCVNCVLESVPRLTRHGTCSRSPGHPPDVGHSVHPTMIADGANLMSAQAFVDWVTRATYLQMVHLWTQAPLSHRVRSSILIHPFAFNLSDGT